MTVAGAVANGSQVRGMCGRESLANRRNYTYSVTYTKNKNLFTRHPSNEALRNACAACRWIDGNSQSQQRIPEPLFGIILGTSQGSRVNGCPATNPPFASTRGRADMQPSETKEPANDESPAEQFLIEVTLNSGAKIQFECSEFSYGRSPISGGKSIEWTTPPGIYPKLISLDLDEVAAIVRLR